MSPFVPGALRSRHLPQDGPGWSTPTPGLMACDMAIVADPKGIGTGERPSRRCRLTGHCWAFTLRWTGEDLELARCARCGSTRHVAARPVEYAEEAL